MPGFGLGADGVEFFVHSPFAKHADGGTVMRNESAIILHATFEVSGRKTRYLVVGDSTWEILKEIVDITRAKGREERLWWDLYNVPHHCSYLALGPDKGKERTAASRARSASSALGALRRCGRTVTYESC